MIPPRISIEWHRFEALTAGELYELLRFRQSISARLFPISTALIRRHGICCCGQSERSPAISG